MKRLRTLWTLALAWALQTEKGKAKKLLLINTLCSCGWPSFTCNKVTWRWARRHYFVSSLHNRINQSFWKSCIVAIAKPKFFLFYLYRQLRVPTSLVDTQKKKPWALSPLLLCILKEKESRDRKSHHLLLCIIIHYAEQTDESAVGVGWLKSLFIMRNPSDRAREDICLKLISVVGAFILILICFFVFLFFFYYDAAESTSIHLLGRRRRQLWPCQPPVLQSFITSGPIVKMRAPGFAPTPTHDRHLYTSGKSNKPFSILLLLVHYYCYSLYSHKKNNGLAIERERAWLAPPLRQRVVTLILFLNDPVVSHSQLQSPFKIKKRRRKQCNLWAIISAPHTKFKSFFFFQPLYVTILAL